MGAGRPRHGNPGRRSTTAVPRCGRGKARDQRRRRADHQVDLADERAAGRRSWPSSAAEAASPFIFQLPATSGRELRHAIVTSFSRVRLAEPAGGAPDGPAEPILLELQGVGPLPIRAPIIPSSSPRLIQTRNALMLRGIHKASSNWLGKAIMAVVLGSWSSASRSGASATFSAASARTRSPRSAAPRSRIEQFRQNYNDRLQQLGRQLRPADHARSGARARARPADCSAR